MFFREILCAVDRIEEISCGREVETGVRYIGKYMMFWFSGAGIVYGNDKLCFYVERYLLGLLVGVNF